MEVIDMADQATTAGGDPVAEPDTNSPTTHEPARRPVIDVSLQRLTPDQVTVKDLSTVDDDREVLRDLVELAFGGGEANVKVSVMGTFDEVLVILEAGLLGLRRVNTERTAAAQ